MFKCDCGAIFEEPDWVEESRGEFWGMPAYERMAYCPHCGDDCFSEIKFYDVYDTPVAEYDTYYDFGDDKVAEENLQDYIRDCECKA